MTKKQFTKILEDIRDSIVQELRENGFFYHHDEKADLRYDPEPWDINNGDREYFFSLVNERVANVKELWLDDFGCCHVVVVWRGDYYDAECCGGVKLPQDLPIIKNIDKTREQVLAEIQ